MSSKYFLSADKLQARIRNRIIESLEYMIDGSFLQNFGADEILNLCQRPIN